MSIDLSNMQCDSFTKDENCNLSIEQIRKKRDYEEDCHISWLTKDHSDEDIYSNVVLPIINDINMSIGTDKTNSSTQTEGCDKDTNEINEIEIKCDDIDDFIDSNVGSKRCRQTSESEEPMESQTMKKMKSSTLHFEMTNSGHELKASLSSSASETSFKSLSSNASFRVRKRRMKSDTNLFKDVLHRSRGNMNISKCLPRTTGVSPRREKVHRPPKSRTSKLIALCSWIGMKGYQSLTNLYAHPDTVRERLLPPEESDTKTSEELELMRTHLERMEQKQTRLEQENVLLHETLNKLTNRIDDLENKLRNAPSCATKGAPSLPPPPPPPPPPLPPPPMMMTNKIQRPHTLPRCGSAPPKIEGPRLTITPQDIANVKLRKTRDNPVKPKQLTREKQPLVTQSMLRVTKAKLGRTRKNPVASSTPKQELSELEKCLLQETSVTSLFRRRVARGTFKSAEELRPRPYPQANSRSPRSPRSPRSNSYPRGKHLSPMKYRPIPINGFDSAVQ